MRIASIALVSAIAALVGAGAHAQGYPAKAVRVVIPNSAGSGLDTLRALAAPDLREQFRNLAAGPISMSRAEFQRFVRSEAVAAARVAKAAGIKPQ